MESVSAGYELAYNAAYEAACKHAAENKHGSHHGCSVLVNGKFVAVDSNHATGHAEENALKRFYDTLNRCCLKGDQRAHDG